MDQATELRALVRQKPRHRAAGDARPRRIVVFGGKGGVGATTIAVNLAWPWQEKAGDACSATRRAATFRLQLRLEPRHSLADVLAGNCSVEDIIYPALPECRSCPAGMTLIQLARRGRTCLEPGADATGQPRAAAGSRRDRRGQPARRAGAAVLAGGRSHIAGQHDGNSRDYGRLCVNKMLDDPARSASIAPAAEPFAKRCGCR